MRTLARIVCLASAAAVAAGAGGCYRKVVAAHGPGADAVTVEQGNLPTEKGTRTLGYPKSEFKKLPGD